MAKNVKYSKEYWIQVLIACSQVTFGVFWAALFIPPFDVYKLAVIILNMLVTILLWLGSWYLWK